MLALGSTVSSRPPLCAQIKPQPAKTASAPATQFRRFLDLPFEIRWAIYNLCLPTRVVDSQVDLDLIFPNLGFSFPCRKLEPTLRFIVGKYSRMPVISRAVPEVYRKLRQHMVPPPTHKRAWNWLNFDHDPEDFVYRDPRPIFFDPKSDIVCIPPFNYWEDPHISDESPGWLARSPDVVVAIEAWCMDLTHWTRSLMNYCFLGRKRCVIVLSETRLIKPMDSIISCGLFGLFGEEKSVLVDVDDFELIDYYDRKLNGQDIHPRRWYKEDDGINVGGIRRYSSHGTVDPQQVWDDDSPVVSAEDRAQLIANDRNEELRRIKLAWLRDNGYWDDISGVNPYSWPSCRDLVIDEENPAAKSWLDKLPEFSFAVRVHAQDLDECKRLWEAKVAWEWGRSKRRAATTG